jgi:hypothetical protein
MTAPTTWATSGARGQQTSFAAGRLHHLAVMRWPHFPTAATPMAALSKTRATAPPTSAQIDSRNQGDGLALHR